MTLEVAVMLALILGALAIFALELLPVEVTAMGFLAVLVGLRFVSLEESLAGLSNKAVVTIGALFIISRALMKTGILEIGTYHLSRRVGQRRWVGIFILLACAGVLSGFLNNTAVIVVFIPLALSLCRRFEISPTKVLLPLSYVSILGGMLTLIGTSTNLLVSSIAEMEGEAPLQMFEFLPIGLIFLAIGLVYSIVLGRHFLPSRVTPGSLTSKYEISGYLTEVQVEADSGLIGKSCREANIRQRYGISVLSIIRKGIRLSTGVGRTPLQLNDLLVLEGPMDDVLRMSREQKLTLLPDVKLDESELSRQGQVVVETLIPGTSDFQGETLRSLEFKQHYGALVLAIRRHGETIRQRMPDIPLKASDSLLLLLRKEELKEFMHSTKLLLISEVDLELHRERFWWLPLALLPFIVIAAVAGLMDILTAALAGAILVMILGVLKPQDAYHSVDWSVIFLIAAFVPVGTAMINTGTADFLASLIVLVSRWFSGGLEPYLTLAFFYLLTSLLTQAVSNNAAAIILTPVAISLAHTEGIDPHAFLIAICFAASAAFMTPLGYQTNLMVYAPGGYRFTDYMRFGAPLNILLWILASLLIPQFWPF
jgi:di/tricarboxylate transporter